MKNLTKILIVAICVVLLAALAVVAISADSAIETDATLKSVSVSAGGNVKINFVYEDFGSATLIDVYVRDEEGNPAFHKAYNVESLGDSKTVSVPLHPDQMRYTVSATATDADGKVGETKYYSVALYAQTVLAREEYAEYHDDMRALLTWGAMADVNFNEVADSKINDYVYSSGTNPVVGLKEAFAVKTENVVQGEAVEAAGYQMFLEAGSTTMRMYFTYEGDATALKATISKAGNAAVSAPVLADADVENLYYVNIYNVGVAVYNKAYTVTVSAGEDSASITKTALEYLNTIAFEGEYNDAQRNLAKSMYQFYVCAQNVDVADCAHDATHKILVKIDGKDAEQKICSLCFENVATHNLVSSNKVVNADGSIAYEYVCNCEECNGAVVYRKNLNDKVYHADVTTTTSTIIATADYVDDRDKAPVSTIVEDGMVYTHVETKGNQVETVIKAENVPATAVIYVKYRLNNGNAPKGWIHSNVKITDESGVEHLISDGTVEKDDLVKRHNGWVVARVNAKGAFDREGLVAGSNALAYTFTIVHSDDIDISYVVAEPTEDNVNGLPYIYSMGEDYYMHCSTVLGSYIDSQWRLINGTSGVKQNDPFTPENTRTPVYIEEAVAANAVHDIEFSKVANSDGTTTYTYTCNCEECDGKLLYRKTLNSAVYHADITSVTSTVTEGEGKADVSQEIAEDGMVYTHVATHGNYVQTVITAENVPATAVIYVKYRLANGTTPEGYMHSRVSITTADGVEHLISDGKTENTDLVKRHNSNLANDGWVVARVNAKGAFDREGLTAGANAKAYTVTITHRDDLDIAYIVAEPTEDNVNGLPYVYSMGDDYYLHVSTYLPSYIASQWRLINGTSGVKQNDPFTPPANTRTPVYVEDEVVVEKDGHDVVFAQTANEDGTVTYTYTCNCDDCDGKVLYRKTLKNNVFHADITTITAVVTQGDGEAEVSQEIAEDGMLYTHVATNGNWVTTTISSEDVPAGMVMYVKYRLANGGTPEGYMASQVNVTTADGKVHLVSSGTVENADLIKNHKGWLVARVNVKGNFTTEGLTSGAVVSNVTMTITHRDDLDIAYFIAEPTEDNVNGLPYVYSMGDDYYLHSSTYLGWYTASQWRLINGTSGTKQNDPFTPPAPTRTPVYVEEAPAGEVEHNIVFNKADNGNGTTTYTYTCDCAECEGAVLYKKTLNSTVFHADITTVTASLTADGTVSIPVSTEIADDGMVYSHVDANGRQTTTVISAENVPAGMVMYVKYRLNNGSAPEGWIHSRITVTTADGVEHLVSDGKVENEDLVKRHTGWVVSRINVKGNFTTEGLTSGAVVSKVTLTITHSDDLDIQYFIAEAGENNADGLPYVYSMGDDYYLHVSTVLGSYIDSQWRLINGTSGVKQNDPFTPPASTRTPVYVEQ